VNIGTSYYYLDPSKAVPAVAAGGLPAATLVANGTYSGPRAAGDQFQFFNLSQYVTQTIQNERKSMSLALEHEVVQECEKCSAIFSTRRPTPTRRSTASRSLRRSPPARTAIRSTPP